MIYYFILFIIYDLIETTAVWKLFLGLSRNISFFNEKLLHSRLLFNNSCFVFDCYENACLSFYGQLRFCLEKYVKGEDHFIKAREIIMSKVMLSVLPFRAWNHMFLCERSQYCTKSYVSNKKISDILMSLLIKMTHLEDLLFFVICIRRALARHFFSGKCI